MADWRALARGGFAIVWQARQESLNRLVAVKVDQRPLDTETEQRRFLREAGAAGRLSGHPGIVTVHDAGILADARPFLVMELCPGGSLTKWLTAEPRPTDRRVRDVGVRIADALAAAHARGVLHRDVKPANILIDAYNHAGLADFGLAALPDPGMELSATLEAITPAYAPPEVFEQQPPTEYGDVYSLAATLYALLSGHPPRGEVGKTLSIADTMAQLQRPITPIPGVDPELMASLLRALDDDPARRPSAAQFRDELAALELPSDPTAESNVGPDGAPVPPGSRAVAAEPAGDRRTWLILAAVIVALVVASLVVVAALRPDGAVGLPPPSATASSTPASPPASPSPSQTAVAVPAGFDDCAEQLGADIYCAQDPECWAGIIGPMDVPFVATPVKCSSKHVYQTFAAGHLDYVVRHQSQLEKDRRAREVCRRSVVNPMLAAKDRNPAWEIIRIPPQDDDNIFRCIFGDGYHYSPYKSRSRARPSRSRSIICSTSHPAGSSKPPALWIAAMVGKRSSSK